MEQISAYLVYNIVSLSEMAGKENKLFYEDKLKMNLQSNI